MTGSETLRRTVEETRKAAQTLRISSTSARQSFLEELAKGLARRRAELERQNALDLTAAEAAGLSKPVLDRLSIQGARIDAMIKNALDVRSLPDPLSTISHAQILPSGLRVERRRVPLGVLMLIYEARPNATVEASALAVKAGNAIVLRGGSEATRSNTVLGSILANALAAAELPRAAVQVLIGVSHEETRRLLAWSDLIDLVIPRGGEKLIGMVREHARMPMLAHGPGVCHIYVDSPVDLSMALGVAINAKTQRPATCNAAETLLVHSEVAAEFLPRFAKEFAAFKGEIRGCERTRAILASITTATDADWATEHLDNILNVRVVDNLDQALAHIERFGTRHTEAILTSALKSAERFTREVDAAAVFVNASTRLNDGSALGMGAELGISTTKFHAFGPMGLSALTVEKTVAVGDGHNRS